MPPQTQFIKTESPALSHFFDAVIARQSEKWDSIRVLSDEKIPKDSIIRINSLVFCVKSTSEYILAILSETDRVNITALEDALVRLIPGLDTDERDSWLSLATSDELEDVCGFAPQTVPPLGLYPAPILTVLEESLTKHTNDFLVGGGGLPGQSTVLPVQTLLDQANVRLANFRKQRSDQLIAFPARSSNQHILRILPGHENEMIQKPFFPVEPPCTEIAKELVMSRDLPINIEPEWVTVIGRIAGIRRMARRLLFADLAPPVVISTQEDDDHPWRDPRSKGAMAVQLILGKTICQKLGDEPGEMALKRLKVGQLVLVQGKTNVGNRDSLRNWVEKMSLDVVIFDYQVLQPDTEYVGETAVLPKHSVSVLGLRHPPKRSAALDMECLRLSDLYSDDETRVLLINDLESVHAFSCTLSDLQMSLTTNQEEGAYATGLVGIDCEWKPNFLLDTSSEPQPVLLLQVCMHSLKKVYLFDLQKMLRPLLSVKDSMNELETAVSEAIRDLFVSDRLVKVGFQVVQDLRRMAASYPHMSSFQMINSVLETSSLAKKVMYMTKERHSKMATSSLSRLTERFIGKTLNKDEQVSDWSSRPLSETQIEYAALDAVVTPTIVEKLLEYIAASFYEKPQLGRWKNDISFSKSLSSWRFHFLETSDANATRKLNAKRIVGEPFIVTQSWVTGDIQPASPSISHDGEGVFTDANGVIRVPAHAVTLEDDLTHDIIERILGERVGKSKDRCVAQLLRGSAALKDGERLEFPQRSGFVEFKNAVALFVNMPVNSKSSKGQPRSYPNEWLEDGLILTWFLRENDWKGGSSPFAEKLTRSVNGRDPTVILFVRLGKGHFLCCGRCKVVASPRSELHVAKDPSWTLVKLHLMLMDWKKLYLTPDFQMLVNPDKYPEKWDSWIDDSESESSNYR